MGRQALGGPVARAADQVSSKWVLRYIRPTVSGKGSQGLGHITVCGSYHQKTH